MSIVLYISSAKCKHVNPDTLLNTIPYMCQLHKTYSNVLINNKIVQEVGYCIQIFEIDNAAFKKKIWKPLKNLLNLTCAYVKKEGEYMGCILNWPGLFRPTICSKL